MENQLTFVQEQSQDAWDYYWESLLDATSLEEVASLNLWLSKRLGDIVSDSLYLEE